MSNDERPIPRAMRLPLFADFATVRRFYCDMLGARELSRAEASESDVSLRFLVGSQMIAVRADVAPAPRVTTVEVPDRLAVAERCWDAGYAVYADEADAAGEVFVIDPLGYVIQLVTP
ncbi:MAG TPA: hypothetical protein VF041_11505 [Gemmatimonadaceae bacterium]